MEKDCEASFYIKLTDDAVAKLPLPESKLLNLVRTYRDFSRVRARKVLFRFKYGTKDEKKDALTWFNQKVSKEEKTYYVDDYVSQVIKFTDEQFCLLADELRLQYQAKDPIFLDIYSIKGIPKGCQNELNILQEKMAEHPVLLFRVVETCVQAKKDPTVSRCIVQLLSTSPVKHTVALDSLGFKFTYRVKISNFSNEIGAFLLAIRQSYVKRQKLLNAQDSFVFPLITLLKQINELDEQINKDIQQDEPTSSQKVSDFESEVLRFIEISSGATSDDPRFDTFTEYRQWLVQLGNCLLNFLQAQMECNNVFAKEKNEGILFAAATNIALSKKMIAVQRNCNEAKKCYYNTLQNFHQFRLEYSEVS